VIKKIMSLFPTSKKKMPLFPQKKSCHYAHVSNDFIDCFLFFNIHRVLVFSLLFGLLFSKFVFPRNHIILYKEKVYHIS